MQPSSPPPQRLAPTPALILPAIILLGLALRLWHLGAASLWNDELFSRYYVDTGLRYLWTTGFSLETTPPTYYTLLLYWVRLAGTSEAALRLPSAIVSTATIPLVFLLGRELAGRTTGLIAALLFAIAPMELYFAQEARAYAFMLPPVALLLLCLAHLLRPSPHPGPSTRPSPSISPAWFIGYAACATAAVYLHNTAVLVVAAAGTVGFAALLAGRAPARIILGFVAANIAAALLCVPALLAMLAQVHANRLAWMLPTRLWDVHNALAVLITGPAATPLLLQTLLAAVLGAALLAALALARPASRLLAVTIAVPALDFALILASSLRQPILVPRVLCWMWIPLAVALAVALTARTRARLPAIAATVLVLATGVGFQLAQNATAKEPWRVLLPRIAPLLAQADLIVTGPWTEPMGLAYYHVPLTHVAHWTNDAPATVENTTIRALVGAPDISRPALQAAIRAGKRVVLIQRSVEASSLATLAVPPPTGTIQQPCWAMGQCMTATYWGMHL